MKRKFAPAEVSLIRRQYYSMGRNTVQLAKQWGADRRTISNMVAGRTYKDCSGPITENLQIRQRKLTPGQIREMRDVWQFQRISYAKLGAQFGLGSGACREAVLGITYKDVLP